MKRSIRKHAGRPRIDLRAIGGRIRELRGVEMTQAEFAHRIGFAQSYLSALDRGEKEPCASVLLAISRECGKSIDWFLPGSLESVQLRCFEKCFFDIEAQLAA